MTITDGRGRTVRTINLPTENGINGRTNQFSYAVRMRSNEITLTFGQNTQRRLTTLTVKPGETLRIEVTRAEIIILD